ncbi:MAG: hypothetical protein ACYDBB_21610, partial [Armatimonadota bacterium]
RRERSPQRSWYCETVGECQRASGAVPSPLGFRLTVPDGATSQERCGERSLRHFRGAKLTTG